MDIRDQQPVLVDRHATSNPNGMHNACTVAQMVGNVAHHQAQQLQVQ